MPGDWPFQESSFSMTKIILTDVQPIYRAGVARLLSGETDLHIVAQCSDMERTLHAITTFPGSLVLFASELHPEWPRLTLLLDTMGSRGIVIAENTEAASTFLQLGLHGVLFRGSSGKLLLECLRTVAAGNICQPIRPENAPSSTEDAVGIRVRERLTPKEMRIVALIVQGCKNREIAFRLKTTEQVIKNYLRSIYDKTGVGDRLELALFVLHHRVLAEAASELGLVMEREENTRLRTLADLNASVEHLDESIPKTGT